MNLNVTNGPPSIRPPRTARWNSLELFSGLTAEDLTAPASLREHTEHELWMNLRAEYDARHLSAFLRSSQISFTPEFWVFEEAWRNDEHNHYLGLRWLYSGLYSMSVEAVDQRLAAQKPDFSQVEHLIADEFTLCVTLAYDEFASARGYAQDFELYEQFGPPPVAQWIRYAARDEMLHHLNAIDLIELHYAERVAEMPRIIDRLIHHDTTEGYEYRSTFLFDHEPDPGHNPFGPEFLRECGKVVCSRFGVEYPVG